MNIEGVLNHGYWQELGEDDGGSTSGAVGDPGRDSGDTGDTGDAGSVPADPAGGDTGDAGSVSADPAGGGTGEGQGGGVGDPGPGAQGSGQVGEPGPGAEGRGADGETFLSTVPEDWRKQIAGDDEKQLKWLERYQSLDAAIKAGYEAQDKIRRGEISSGLPENPTEEQLAEWREAHGVPETPDQYDLALDEGLVLSDADQRIMGAEGGVYEVAHKHDISSEAMQDLVNAMLRGREHEQQAMQTQDNLDRDTASRQLKEQWGGDYDRNIQMAVNWLNTTMPSDVAELVAGARLPDGRALFNVPEIMVGLVDNARALNPAATVVPGASNPVQAISDEIASLEKKIGTDEWWENPQMQKRYRELLETKDKMAANG